MPATSKWMGAVRRWFKSENEAHAAGSDAPALSRGSVFPPVAVPQIPAPASEVARPHLSTCPRPIETAIPGRSPIELIAYYEQFRDYYPNCELSTKRWFVENVERDWVILDCGANIGYYTILLAQLAPNGTVHAFEPTFTYEMMERNLQHARITNVVPQRLALGKHSGVRRDGIFRIWGDDPELLEYSFSTIDDYVTRQSFQRLDCIKVDVDSFDFEVLLGAEATLRKFDPYVVVELNHALSRRGQNNMEALEWMWQQGYREALVLDHDNFVFHRRTSVLRGEARPEMRLQFGKPEMLGRLE